MNTSEWREQLDQLIALLISWVSSPILYAQLGLILVSIVIAFSLAAILKKLSPVLSHPPESGPWLPLKKQVNRLGYFLSPLLIITFLGISVELSEITLQQSLLVRLGQSLAIVFLFYSVMVRFVTNPYLEFIFKWFVVPILVLQVFGWLDNVTSYLETFDFEVGNIRVSAYGLARAIVFGSILFWLGRLSNKVGQQLIRRQERLDIGTREVFAQLFQVFLLTFFFILLLQIMGINLTALTVFGGALGVGLGFGLQAIASNFISGLIILLDGSLKVGDFIELDDGRSGTIVKMNIRSTMVETYSGKDIMVPNEQFITTRFVNWTHNNPKQRYSIEFQVAYKTDIPRMLDIIKEVVRSHPQVINEPETPIEELADAEISGFGESGVDILVEFWMEGIDDGVNRVGADLLLLIWQALRDNDIEIPFPQREVKILNSGKDCSS
ncbi:MAG: mechanosensitive ion channel [Desulfofustis sp.]|nr:mechanosensitive ion channel [Desulfofustis sp.]NNK57483.1 mechanosensitive ion channel [Desulfofustis sp.]